MSTGISRKTSHLGLLSFVIMDWIRWLHALCSLQEQYVHRGG